MSPNSGTLILRCDASTPIGTGHVLRCLALAQAWQDAGGRAVFAMAEDTPSIRERLLAENVDVVRLEIPAGGEDDLRKVTEVALRHAATWMVVDGYKFGANYQRHLKAAGLKLLFVDDNGHAGHYSADLLLNQNAHADDSLYASRETYTRLLLGPRYALLRREFAPWGDWKREIPAAGGRVLLTMGGSDPDNCTALVIESLSLVRMEGLEVTVVIGGCNLHSDSLRRAAASFVGKIRFQTDVPNMPELMAWADVAVSAAGTTCWEMCLLGLPAILVHLAENQRPVAQSLEREGAAIYLGGSDKITRAEVAGELEGLLLSAEDRAAMSHKARRLVDGQGAKRVVASLQGVHFRIRMVEERDCRLLWEWANDPAVRSVSFSPEPIPLDQHIRWFRSTLANDDVRFYLITDSDDLPLGQVRYQIEGSRAVVSVCLGPQCRGKGYGQTILHLATEELFRSSKVTALDAYVKPKNETSRRLFSRAGFKQGATNQVSGQEVVHFVLMRNGV